MTDERQEIREAKVVARVNKTKAQRALEKHRQLMSSLGAAEQAIKRAKRIATS